MANCTTHGANSPCRCDLGDYAYWVAQQMGMGMVDPDAINKAQKIWSIVKDLVRAWDDGSNFIKYIDELRKLI